VPNKQRIITVPRKLTRTFEVDIDIAGRQQTDDGSVLFPITISSEYPVRRSSWGGPYFEILSHDPDDIDLSRAAEGLPALKNHDTGIQVGSVTGIKLDNEAKRLRGLLGFSAIQVAADQRTLVEEGHLKTISVGYFPRGYELVKEDEDGVPTYRVNWTPAEVSLAPVPADPTVGIGRGEDGELERVAGDDMVEFVVRTSGSGTGPAPDGRKDESTKEEREADMPPEKKERIVGTPPAASDPAELTRDLGAEAAEIAELCQTHDRGDEAAKYIREGATPAHVRKIILDGIATRAPAAPPSESLEGLPAKDRARYSYVRVAQALIGERKLDGLEREIHDELVATGQKRASHGGILVPWRIRRPENELDLALRTLGTGEPTGGATLVDTEKGDMIDLLRSKTRVIEYGARVFTGLTGVLEFPKKTGAPTVHWMGENPASAVAASETTYGYTTMSPKTLIGQIQYPRQLLVQASIDVEADFTNELGIGHAKAFDLAAIHGDGTAKQPMGIYHAADVQSHAVGGVPDLDDTGTMVGLGDGEMDGYAAGATTQVSKVLGAGSDEHGLIFGNWNEIMLGLWGNELELIVDEKSRAGFGQIQITSFGMADVAIRHPEAFVKGTGAKIA
jgi:hypothetical protein